MFKLKFITLLFNQLFRKTESRPSSSILIEVTPELFERCARFNVAPEDVINDFVANICYREPESNTDCETSELDGWKSAVEYLSSAYANLRVVNLRSVERLRNHQIITN